MEPTVWVKKYEEEDLTPVPHMIAGRWKRYLDSTQSGERLISGLGCLDPGAVVLDPDHPGPVGGTDRSQSGDAPPVGRPRAPALSSCRICQQPDAGSRLQPLLHFP